MGFATTDQLRVAAATAGLAQSVLSARALAAKYKLGDPVSLRDLIEELAPEQVVFETGSMEAGDVSGSARLGLLSSGWWSFTGKLADGGDFYGDNYALVLATNCVDPAGNRASVKETGHIDAGDEHTFEHQGKNPWIEEHWEQIRNKGFQWRIQADPSIGSGDILPLVLKALLVGFVIVFVPLWLNAESEGKCYWYTDESGNKIRRCEP